MGIRIMQISIFHLADAHNSHDGPSVVSDVNHAADLIKKKRERPLYPS